MANKPILFYGLEDMAEAGHHARSASSSATPATRSGPRSATAPRWGLEVTYIPQDEPLGLAHCVLIARDFLGDDDFVMYLGDNMLRQGLAEFVDRFEADRGALGRPPLDGEPSPPSAQILLARVADPQRFGVAEVDADGEVVRLVEKPDDPPSDLALVGVYLFDATIHEAVARHRAVGPGRARDHRRHPVAHRPRPPGPPRGARRLVDRHRQEGPAARGQPPGARDARAARSTARSTTPRSVDGRVVIEAGRRDRQQPPSGARPSSARGTRIVNSYVGPFTSIGRRLRDRRHRDRALGRARAQPHRRRPPRRRLADRPRRRGRAAPAERPRATRLMLGDHSRVDLE